MAMVFGGLLALIHAFFSIHLRADQIVAASPSTSSRSGSPGYLFSDLYSGGIQTSEVSRVPTLSLDFLDSVPGSAHFLHDVFGGLSLLVWLMLADVGLTYFVLFRTPLGLRIRSVGEHPRAADTVGISVYGIRYLAVTTSGMLAALGGAFLSIGFVGTFSENMTSGRGFIALAAVIFGKWRPGWRSLRRCSSGSALRSRSRSSARPASPRTSSRLPVHPDARRRGRPHRPLDPACRRWPSLRQAVTGRDRATARRAGRSCWVCSHSLPSRLPPRHGLI